MSNKKRLQRNNAAVDYSLTDGDPMGRYYGKLPVYVPEKNEDGSLKKPLQFVKKEKGIPFVRKERLDEV